MTRFDGWRWILYLLSTMAMYYWIFIGIIWWLVGVSTLSILVALLLMGAASMLHLYWDIEHNG